MSEQQQPGMPPQGTPRQERPAAPNNVVIAFGIFVITAVLWVVRTLTSQPGKQALIGQLHRTRPDAFAEFSPQQLSSVVDLVLTIAIVLWIAIALLCVFLAWRMWAGRNWARITLTVICAFGVVFGVSGGFWAGGLLPALGVVAMYLPSSNAYFAITAAVRRGR